MTIRKSLVIMIGWITVATAVATLVAQANQSGAPTPAVSSQFREYGQGETIASLLSKSSGTVTIARKGHPPYGGGLPGESAQSFPSPNLKRLALNSDVVVVGSVLSKSAYLTDDQTFLYTQYSIQIEKVGGDSVSPFQTRR